MSELAVALIQMRTPATQAAALAQAEPLIRQAAAGGAQLIATPEGTNLLQRDRAKMFDILRTAEDDVCVQGLIALAAELKVWLLIGSALVRRPDGGAAKPLQAKIIVDVAEAGGRTVERVTTLPVRAKGVMIGVKQDFEDNLSEGDLATFEAIAVSPDGKRVAFLSTRGGAARGGLGTEREVR